MIKQTYLFKYSATNIFFNMPISSLTKLVDVKQCVIITDENIFALYKVKFKKYNTIVLKAGEEYKVQQTADSIIKQLLEFDADRNTILIGVGGGVITDITGYVASIYKRGVQLGFVPTTLLAMIDASIGGKNGIDVGHYKNMVGCFKQPNFILFDFLFLKTLPQKQWQQAFAEIIKHACIKDAALFKEIQINNLQFYRSNKKALIALIEKNIVIKLGIVQKDELENGERKLLNFGHTLAHALENLYQLNHGNAVSIGIAFAVKLSQKITGFNQTSAVIELLNKYNLPVELNYKASKVFEVLKKDKKRNQQELHFVLLNKIGKAVIVPIPLQEIEKLL
ncbi:MAG TPA: 3-dehydroquinate synthase [Chitinophagaceae bacterium]|nr:3-dehydroquinate synthase [Chitinophagaceae bacterium]MCC6634334.1 3-dehydroquinate synthase [Chitinophagaceae bacterium]HMZ45691.1 3-dehydroquinate synthase [Chitinophagaceae bacterium]HNE92850.1 3-dehydroquinate synthase [Chitinophagaceae bacterium]HNF29167.1 3-dehydroquinate synthase [Chitinophagaceae bacterium]